MSPRKPKGPQVPKARWKEWIIQEEEADPADHPPGPSINEEGSGGPGRRIDESGETANDGETSEAITVVSEGSSQAKDKVFTDLCPEEEEDMVDWLEANPVIHNIHVIHPASSPAIRTVKRNICFGRMKRGLLVKMLAFAEQGMLYGVQMFAQNHGVTLQSTDTEEAKVVWRVFHDSIVLVLVRGDDGGSDVHANTLLDHIFQTMVMFLGLDSLTRLKNVERLRRELRVCYPVIDSLLEEGSTFDSLSESVEILSSVEGASLQEPLESFVTDCDSTFGCVHCNGRLLVATAKWWSLSGQEMMLLCRLVRSLPRNSASDIPVYLPHASPKVPHRLLSVHLLSGAVVSVLCLDVPTLSTVQSKLIESHWLPSFDTLKACINSPVTNIPKTVSIDPGILGFVAMSTDQHKCIASCELPIVRESIAERRPLTVEKRRRILSSFYRNTVGSIFPVIHSPERKDPSGERPLTFPHSAEETYMNGLDHKCYAICSKDARLFVIFSAAVPHHAVRSVSHQFLDGLRKLFTDIREKKS